MRQRKYRARRKGMVFPVLTVTLYETAEQVHAQMVEQVPQSAEQVHMAEQAQLPKKVARSAEQVHMAEQAQMAEKVAQSAEQAQMAEKVAWSAEQVQLAEQVHMMVWCR